MQSNNAYIRGIFFIHVCHSENILTLNFVNVRVFLAVSLVHVIDGGW